MIKNLFIVRHGKASDYNNSSDIDRPLKESGLDDVYKMAKHFLDKNIVTDLIISSTAIRALHTASILARTFEIDTSKIILNDDLYLANPEMLIDIITKTNNDINSLMIVGHNPGLTDLANRYFKNKISNMPTSGIAGFKFETDSWAKVEHLKTIESFFDYPKNI